MNSHITKYLDYYLGLPHSPKFAVLLKGPWGSGKTWFINDYIESQTDHTRKFLRISFYGVGGLNEIDTQISQQIHPILNSKPMIITEKIIKGAIKFGLKIDLDGDSKDDGSLNIQVPDLIDENNLQKYVMVFDDVERSNMEISQVLGYINSFTEQAGLKTIILMDDTKIVDEKYLQIKEKTIGKTFKIDHNIDSVFDTFLTNIDNTFARELLTTHKQEILALFATAKYNNLRHLYQTFLDFERFIANIEEKFLLLIDWKKLIKIFFSFSFELKKGAISTSDIRGIRISIANAALKQGQGIENSLDWLLSKYFFLNDYDLILSLDKWADLFEYGHISQAELSDIFTNIYDESAPAWMKLWRVRDISSDDTFEQLKSEVLQQWENHHFTKPSDILHVCGIFLWLSKTGFYNKRLKDIVKNAKEYIDYIKDGDEWNEAGDKIEEIDLYWGGYSGLGFYENKSKEFISIMDYLNDQIKQFKEKLLPSLGIELLKLMETDVYEFIEMTTLSNSANQKYYRTAIFQHISAQDFYTSYCKMDNSNKKYLVDFFHERYRFPEISKDLIKELQFLKQLRKLLRDKAKDSKKLLSGYLMSELEQSIQKTAINQLQPTKKSEVNLHIVND